MKTAPRSTPTPEEQTYAATCAAYRAAADAFLPVARAYREAQRAFQEADRTLAAAFRAYQEAERTSETPAYRDPRRDPRGVPRDAGGVYR